jgi:hypothetical protein
MLDNAAVACLYLLLFHGALMSMTIRSFKNIFLIPVIIFAVFFAPAPASADQAKDAAAFVQKLG